MEHAVHYAGDALIAQYGPLPIIGVFVTVGAIGALLLAVFGPEDSRGAGAAIGAVLLVVAVVAFAAGYGSAQDKCRQWWHEEHPGTYGASLTAGVDLTGNYASHHCYNVVSCTSLSC